MQLKKDKEYFIIYMGYVYNSYAGVATLKNDKPDKQFGFYEFEIVDSDGDKIEAFFELCDVVCESIHLNPKLTVTSWPS